MSEDTAVLDEKVATSAIDKYERKIPITIQDRRKNYSLNLPEYTDLSEVLRAVGLDSARVVRESYSYKTGPGGEQIRRYDPIVTISRKGRIQSEVIYDLTLCDKDKLKAYLREHDAETK